MMIYEWIPWGSPKKSSKSLHSELVRGWNHCWYLWLSDSSGGRLGCRHYTRNVGISQINAEASAYYGFPICLVGLNGRRIHLWCSSHGRFPDFFP